MTRPLRAEEEAIRELEEAVRWYEDQRPGLGDELLAEIESTLQRIERWPGAGAPVPRVPAELSVRRAPVKRFPYFVVYLDTAEAIRVLAFAHDRRRPGYWRSRYRNRR